MRACNIKLPSNVQEKTFGFFFFFLLLLSSIRTLNTVKHYTHTHTNTAHHLNNVHCCNILLNYNISTFLPSSYVIIIIYSVNIICILIIFNIQFFFYSRTCWKNHYSFTVLLLYDKKFARYYHYFFFFLTAVQ